MENITSVNSKQIVLLELTAPWEDCIDHVNERKRDRYAELVEECEYRWRARCQLKQQHLLQSGCGSGGEINGWSHATRTQAGS